jgi:tRNA modification GTPase
MNAAPAYVEDTIVAAATPPGKGGVGIVRISGPGAPLIAAQMLGSDPAPRHATHAEFRDADGTPVDSGIALWFPAPASFTGESVLELQGHGGPMVMSLLVDAAVRLGARRAEPGEFSRRAFLNGKLDLVQAEAIADLIDSGTAQAARAAHRSLTGAFSTAVDELAGQLIRLRLHVEAALDFPEEEIDFLADEGLLAVADQCASAFARLEAGTAAGRLLRDGLQVVIVGPPNAGKSSLLNLLSGQETAIVTEVAGTTRDVLRERLDIDGLAVELVDTAGLREDPDRIEAEGIRRARQALAGADAVLWIHDAAVAGTDPPDETLPPGVPVVTVNNKIDLTGAPPGVVQEEPLILNLSAKSGAGTDVLKDAIKRIAGYRDHGEGAFTARQRHLDAIRDARAHFDQGLKVLATNRAGELFAEELRLAQSALAGITGEFSSDDLLGRIFAEFCIGK